MNKIFLLSLILPLMFLACSDDDNKEDKDSIIGVWTTLTTIKAVDTVNDTDNFVYLDILEKNQEGAYIYWKIKFLEDGTFIKTSLKDGKTLATGTYKHEGNKLKIEYIENKSPFHLPGEINIIDGFPVYDSDVTEYFKSVYNEYEITRVILNVIIEKN